MSDEKTKHTAGPWSFEVADLVQMQRSYREDPKRSRIEAIGVYSRAPGMEGTTVIAISHNPEDGFDLLGAASEHVANLILIAAAPDLLDAGTAALAAMREMHEAAQAGRQVFLDRGAHDALAAALAKARGQS